MRRDKDVRTMCVLIEPEKKQPEAVDFRLLSLSEQMFVRIAMLLLFAWGS